MLVSPAEPLALRNLGTVSSRCEEYGADFLIVSENFGLGGVQRKEISDLVQSVYDDRVSREVILLKELDWAAWIIEGIPQFTSEGESMWTRTHYTRSQHLGLLFTLNFQGFLLFSTSTTAESGLLLLQLEHWTQKEKHSGLNTRKGARGVFGQPDIEEQQIHFLQGIQGLGYDRARAIRDYYGGLPLTLVKDVSEVPGIGKKTAEKMKELFSD